MPTNKMIFKVASENKFYSKNCMVCILWPFLFFTLNSTFGYACPHKSKYAVRTEFSKHYPRIITNALFTIIFICKFVYGILNLRSVETNDMVKLIVTANENFFCIGSIVVFVYNLVGMTRRINLLNGYQTLCENPQCGGLDDVLDFKASKHLQDNIYKQLIGVLLIVIEGLLLSFIELENWSNLGEIVWIFLYAIGNFSQVNDIVFFSFECQIFYEFLNKMHERLMLILSQKIKLVKTSYEGIGVNYITNHEMLPDNQALLINLQKCQIFYHKVMRIFVTFNNELFNPTFLFWYIFMMLHSVINLYVYIINYLNDGINYMMTLGHLILFTNIALSVYVLVYFLSHAERLGRSGEKISSFLFRYPISKLTMSEAAQVEILVKAFYTQQPVLRASDIFTVETTLIASITGTIITYVLVALQFHASWSQE